MKRFGYGLLVLFFLLTLACGSLKLSTAPPPAPTTPTLKENQFRGLLVKTDGKTGDLTFEVDGKEKTYPRTNDFKAYTLSDTTKASPFFAGNFLMRDVLVTFEKKDGKEVVIEMRVEKSTPSTKGTKVDGKFTGADYNKPIPDLLLEVNGQTTKYPMAKRTRFFLHAGDVVTGDTTRAFLNTDVTIILDKEDGVDRVIEVWAK